jgi:hypothetical protein
MLEYLYDLLDEAERQAMQDHLTGCAACRAELDRAKEQQQLLAAAARMEFPDVRFVAPTAPEPVADPRPAAAPAPTLPLKREPARQGRRRWLRWAVAAAILLAVCGLAGAGRWVQGDYAGVSKTIKDKDAAAAEAQKQINDLTAAINVLPRDERQEIEKVRNAEREAQLKVAVVGQETVTAGASATYEIQTLNLNNQPVAADVKVQVADAGKQPVGDAIPVVRAEDGKYRITLPPDLPVKPDSRLTLVVSAKRESGLQATVSEGFDLAPPVYMTHLDTDKPMYQPGEVVHYRSLTLDRFSLKPAEEDLRLTYELITPTGARKPLVQGANGLREAAAEPAAAQLATGLPVLGPDNKALRGIGAGDFQLDPKLEGGEYTLVCREENNRFAEQHRKFLVNTYSRQQLDKKLDFSRSSYGPGDEVAASCEAKLAASGEPVRNQPVEATVLIDDEKYGADGTPTAQPIRFQTDSQGKVVVHFKLPDVVERGEASLGVKFLGKPVETITRPLPIVLKKLNVEFYPEGGDLAADVPNRVYFQVRTPLGKPADLSGRLLEDGQALPVVVETLHDDKEPGVNQGMGRFEFTPKSGKLYQLQIDSPAGIADRIPLPKVIDDRVALSVQDGVAAAGQAIKASVHSKAERELMVGLYCRGRLLESVQLKKGETEAVLNPDSGAGGVCRVTVFEETATAPNRRELKPVAERLIYRRPAEKLDVVITPDRSSYVPGDAAKLQIATKTEKGEAAPAIAQVVVVDKSVLTLADEKTYKSMPTHFLLTSEVRRPEDLEYADFLLGPQAKAEQALDLLLGVQGWRRFAEQDPATFRKNNLDKEEAERLLVSFGVAPRKIDADDAEIDRIHQDEKARLTMLYGQLNQATDQLKAAKADAGYATALARKGSYDRLWEQARLIGTPLVGASLLVAALAFLVLALRNRFRRAVFWYAAAAASVALMVAAVLMYRMGETPVATEDARLAKANAAGAGRDNLQEQADNFLAEPMAPDVKELEGAPLPAADFGMVAGNAPFKDKALPAPQAPLAGLPPPPAPPAGFQPATVPGGLGADKPQAPLPPVAKPGEAKDDANAAHYAANRGQDAQIADDAKKLFRFTDRDQAEQLRKDAEDGKKEGDLALDARYKREAKQKGAPAAEREEEARRALVLEQNLQNFDRLRDIADGKRPVMRAPTTTMLVREYAHEHGPGASALRSDFAETLYWHPALVLPDGKADVAFDLSDSATSFQALVFAHTLDGRLGSGVQVIESRLPFTLQPATPIEVTASDKIMVPVTITNNTSETRDVPISADRHDNLRQLTLDTKWRVKAGETNRAWYAFQPTAQEGDAVLDFVSKADSFPADAVRAKIHIAPEGFPVAESKSDLLEGSASQTVTLPDAWVKGTLKCQVQVFPSTLADLQKGLDSLLREPNGCFEQTSTSNYPNLLILDYLKESDQAKPEVEHRAREMLARGYQKLTSFECTNTAKSGREGYEWFGGAAPPHEALTAYGLLEFRDMARVQDVDPAMLKRTQEYLMSRRDGKGGFLRNQKALDSFGRAPENVTNAYIIWALTESGKDDDLTKELDALADQAKASKDPYFLSLVANSLINRARTDEASAILKTVAGAQKDDGHLDAEKTSITGSGGRDLQIETTALAVLGWLKADPGAFNGALQKAAKWIGMQRGGFGGFGSTQSTILALKALIAYTKANKRTTEGGELRLFVGDKEAAKLDFAAGASDALALELKDAEHALHAGRNDVRIEVTGKNVFPYTLAWTYQTLKPADAADCPVRLDAKLSETQVQEGDLVRLNVTLENVSGKGQGMATAVIGLPGGMTLPEDMKQLKLYCRQPEDGSRPLVSAFEVRGRELVLYWRDLAPGQKIQVPLDLIARVPGEYTGPASRGYLYYNADHKHWVDPLHVTIAAKTE